ncbi:MAG: cob(I)yrinic acid a,c-diamide adenosyltransferase [Candidatus Limnocylindrales bacterium]
MSAGRRPAIAASAVATGKGDDGTTGLLFGGSRIGKDDSRTEAYGTIDETVAALGLARAELIDASGKAEQASAAARLAAIVLRFQRELFVVGAELASNPEAHARLEDGRTRVSEAMLVGLEATLRELEDGLVMPNEFVVPGETRASAAIELARTILRRAERRTVALRRAGLAPGEWLVPYLNRLADVLWVLARVAEGAESRAATPARVDGRRARGGAAR